MQLRTTVTADFGQEVEIMPILRMRKEKYQTAVSAYRLLKYYTSANVAEYSISQHCANAHVT